MICSKCKIEKPEDQYETYWHSRPKKFYTRRICKSCTSIQKKEYKLKIKQDKLNLIEEPISTEIVQPEVPESIVEDFSNNSDYKFCPSCEEYKLKSNYYASKQTGKLFRRCKDCHNTAAKKAQSVYWDEKKSTIGIESIDPRPGVFLCPVQKEQTHWLLNLIGWKQVNDKWVKDGIKEWNDGKIVWPNVPEQPKKTRKGPKPQAVLDMDLINKMREQGMTFNQIAIKFKVTGSTIIKYYYQQK